MIPCWYLFNIFVDDEDNSSMALDGVELENFGVPYAHFESLYPNFQNEWRHDIYIYVHVFINMKNSSWILKYWYVIFWVTI